MTDWYVGGDAAGAERLAGAWKDAPTENLELLGMLTDVARLQVMRYGLTGEVPSDDITLYLTGLGYTTDVITEVLDLLDIDAPPVPTNWVYAQLQQCKNLWNAGRAQGDGDVGPDGFVFQPRPLDKTIRGIIKPPSGDVDVL